MRARGCKLHHVSVSVLQVGSTGNFSKPASDNTCDNETTCLLLVLRMLVSPCPRRPPPPVLKSSSPKAVKSQSLGIRCSSGSGSGSSNSSGSSSSGSSGSSSGIPKQKVWNA